MPLCTCYLKADKWHGPPCHCIASASAAAWFETSPWPQGEGLVTHDRLLPPVNLSSISFHNALAVLLVSFPPDQHVLAHCGGSCCRLAIPLVDSRVTSFICIAGMKQECVYRLPMLCAAGQVC